MKGGFKMKEQTLQDIIKAINEELEEQDLQNLEDIADLLEPPK